jgi:hypothetical protein
MKLKSIIALFFSASLLFTSCGDSKPSVEVNKEMTEFMGLMKGSDKDVDFAVKKFASTPTIAQNDMVMYKLSEPTVISISADGKCYMMEAKAGITVRSYNICWEAGKITGIEDKGMK